MDVVLTHDPGLAPYGAIRTNEFYVSQYLDLTPVTTGARHGPRRAAEHARPGGARGCCWGRWRRGTGWATDTLQLVRGAAAARGARGAVRRRAPLAPAPARARPRGAPGRPGAARRRRAPRHRLLRGLQPRPPGRHSDADAAWATQALAQPEAETGRSGLSRQDAARRRKRARSFPRVVVQRRARLRGRRPRRRHPRRADRPLRPAPRRDRPRRRAARRGSAATARTSSPPPRSAPSCARTATCCAPATPSSPTPAR